MRVDLDDGQHVLARTVVMATGAKWRELQAEGVDRFRGAGVYHAAMATDAERCRGEDVIVVGGGNSAGQAAVHLASRARSVRVVVRGSALKSTMSAYLVDRIERSPHIEVLTETEVTAVHGSATVESVSLRNGDGSVRQEPTTAVFVMIGANPCTEAAQGMLASTPPATCCAARARRRARPTSRGRSATASRTCWRPSAPACSPPATCAPAPRTAWRERSATERWSCASRTTCSTAPSGRRRTSTAAG